MARPRVEAVTSGYSEFFCRRCRVKGHILKSCPSKQIMCFACGRKGVRTSDSDQNKVGRLSSTHPNFDREDWRKHLEQLKTFSLYYRTDSGKFLNSRDNRYHNYYIST